MEALVRRGNPDIKLVVTSPGNGERPTPITAPKKLLTMKIRYPQEEGETKDAYEGRITAYRSIKRGKRSFKVIEELRTGQNERFEARQRGEEPEPLIPRHTLYDTLSVEERGETHLKNFNAWQERRTLERKPVNGVQDKAK